MGRDSRLLQARDRNGRGVLVTFVWHRDRFAHTVAATDGRRVVPVLASAEGTGQDPWPPSPTLQNLSIEQRATGTEVALLVGMAGTSHWSLSVEADPASRALVFEVACRLNDPAARLGSAYRTMLEPRRAERGVCVVFEGYCRLQLEPLADEPAPRLEPTDLGLAIAVPLAGVAFPATLRWRYRISRPPRALPDREELSPPGNCRQV